MKTIALFCALLLVLPVFGKPPLMGRFLLLDNEELLEGEIVRSDEWYTIKRSVGETQVPAHRVLALTNSRFEALQVLRRQANLRDVDERLRLCRWCLIQNLKKEALEEAEAALKIRPTHPEARSLAEGLKAVVATVGTVNNQKPAPKPNDLPLEFRDSSELPELNGHTIALFSNKIQPILMNACARCHAGEQSGNYKLVRVFATGSNRAGTLHNLFATLQQLNKESIAQSPLWIKATTPHGTPPTLSLRDPNSPALSILEAWIREVVQTEEVSDWLKKDAETTNRKSAKIAAPPLLKVDPKEAGTEENPKPAADKPIFAENKPKKIDPKEDPFDPAIFNTLGKALPKKE